MNDSKTEFLKNDYIPMLQTLDPVQKGNWGKMDAQQMVEHMRDVCKVANGKIVLAVLTPPDQLEKRRAFLFGEQPFAQGIKAAMLKDEPRPHKYKTMPEAIDKMKEELDAVFAVYDADPSLVLLHPVFGGLNYEQQIHYLVKHAEHHLRQFGLVN